MGGWSRVPSLPLGDGAQLRDQAIAVKVQEEGEDVAGGGEDEPGVPGRDVCAWLKRLRMTCAFLLSTSALWLLWRNGDPVNSASRFESCVERLEMRVRVAISRLFHRAEPWPHMRCSPRGKSGSNRIEEIDHNGQRRTDERVCTTFQHCSCDEKPRILDRFVANTGLH